MKIIFFISLILLLYFNYKISNSENFTEDELFTTVYHNCNILANKKMTDRLKKNVYEKQEIGLIELIPRKKLRESKVLDLGACLGVVSIIVNKKLNNKEDHVCVEANTDLIPVLQKNRDKNDCKFKIENSIISNTSDGVFYIYDNVVAGSAHRKDNIEKNKKKLKVKVLKLSELIKKHNVTFDFIIMDIEGGELEFLKENKNYIKNNVKYLLIEIHEFIMYKGYEKKCLEIIENTNMELIKKDGISFLFENKRL